MAASLFSGIYYLGRRGAVGQSDRLITRGIYRYVRNPIYSGVSLTLLGVGLFMTRTGVVLAGMFWLTITFIQSKREEKDLAKRFGNTDTDYKKNMPLFLPDFSRLIKDIKRQRDSFLLSVCAIRILYD